MIVEITDDDIKRIGSTLSREMIDRIDRTWQGAFGLSYSLTPFEILRVLYEISNDHESTDGQTADSFAAYLEVESFGILYTKLLTGVDYTGYLDDGRIEEFIGNNIRTIY